jgi:serine/threonine-protein kinase
LLSVVCFPACDQVIDNGKPLGPSPIFQRPVPAGEHRLKLSAGSAVKVITTSVAESELKIVKQPMQ